MQGPLHLILPQTFLFLAGVVDTLVKTLCTVSVMPRSAAKYIDKNTVECRSLDIRYYLLSSPQMRNAL